VRVTREVQRPRHVVRQRGLERARRRAVEHLGAQPRRLQPLGLVASGVEPGGRAEDGQDTVAAEAEVETGQRGQLPVEGEARLAEIADDGQRPPHVGVRAVPLEAPEPGGEGRIETRLDPERALGIGHPLQPLPQHAGRGQRHGVAGHDEAGIAVGAARGDVRALEQRHRRPGPGQVVRRADPDDAAADHDDHAAPSYHARSASSWLTPSPASTAA